MRYKILLFLIAALMSGCSLMYPVAVLAPKSQIRKNIDSYDEAVRQERFDVAEEKCFNTISEYQKKGLVFDWPYRNLSEVYDKQGKYEEAIEAKKIALKHSSPEGLWDEYHVLGDLYLSQGNYGMALDQYTTASKYGGEGYIIHPYKGPIDQINPILGDYYLETANYANAIACYRICIREYIGRGMDISLGIANYYMGNEQAAEEKLTSCVWHMALDEYRIRALGGTLAPSSTWGMPLDEYRLRGQRIINRIEERRENRAGAILACQSLLGRTLINKNHRKTVIADAHSEIGRLQILQGQPDEAAKSFNEAMQIRSETATATHPNYADALKGLADAAAYKNQLSSASLQVAEALAILDKSVLPTHPRTAPVLIALTSIRKMAGKSDPVASSGPSTAALDARLSTILQKPLGPWKDDFLDTAAFYAQLLKKSGKQSEAARLEQLAAKQKEKN